MVTYSECANESGEKWGLKTELTSCIFMKDSAAWG
jgi:hypothetical protein